MTSETEHPSPDQTPSPTEQPTAPIFPPDRIEIHSDPGTRPASEPTPRPEKREINQLIKFPKLT